jgi:tRNA(Ile)-lysidine synthase
LLLQLLQQKQSHVLIEKSNSSTQFAGGILKVETLENQVKITDDANIVQLDVDKVQFPLILRKWKTLEIISILWEWRKRKRSARFLIDKKLSTTQKENVWINRKQSTKLFGLLDNVSTIGLKFFLLQKLYCN